MEGLLCQTYDKTSPLIHLMTISYVASLPKSENLLSVKQKILTFMHCDMCKTNRKSFAGSKTAQRRSWPKAQTSSKKTQNMVDGQRENLQVLEEMSMQFVESIHVRYLFIKIHPNVDIYAIVGF